LSRNIPGKEGQGRKQKHSRKGRTGQEAEKVLTRRERAGHRAAPNQDGQGRTQKRSYTRRTGQEALKVLTRKDREGSRGKTDSAKRHMYTIIHG
jgi:hypothetical protein